MLFRSRYAGTLGLAGQWEDGIAAAEHGLVLNPTLSPLHGWLSQAYDRMGEPAKSDGHRRLFERFSRLDDRKDAQGE